MGREPDEGVGTQDATGQRDRRVVLADVHAVGPGLERQVGTVVQDEGHTVLVADGDGRAGSIQERSGLEVLVAQLHDVHPAVDARGEKRCEIRSVRRAEIEVATRKFGARGHVPARARAFMAFFVALTF